MSSLSVRALGAEETVMAAVTEVYRGLRAADRLVRGADKCDAAVILCDGRARREGNGAKTRGIETTRLT